jgi:hypothetical protein
VWRTAALILFVVALAGPWPFDEIHVPAEFECSPPNVRLQGDFCGTPLPGRAVFTWVLGGFFSMLGRGAVSPGTPFPSLLAVSFVLLLVLPFVTTLLLIIGNGRRSRLQVPVWGLATIVALFYALARYSGLYPAFWGIWLYVWLAAGALTLELLVIVASRGPVPEQ